MHYTLVSAEAQILILCFAVIIHGMMNCNRLCSYVRKPEFLYSLHKFVVFSHFCKCVLIVEVYSTKELRETLARRGTLIYRSRVKIVYSSRIIYKFFGFLITPKVKEKSKEGYKPLADIFHSSFLPVKTRRSSVFLYVISAVRKSLSASEIIDAFITAV